MFDIPIPPAPTIAMFNVALGAWNPRPPSTYRGRIMAPRATLVVSAMKSRRVGL